MSERREMMIYRLLEILKANPEVVVNPIYVQDPIDQAQAEVDRIEALLAALPVP